MGIFDLFRQPDIDQGVKAWQSVSGAILLDVRGPEEYRAGHIPGSRNIPLPAIDKVGDVVQNKDVPLYVYCYSGARSRRAAGMLEHMGYTKVHNIGGMAAYSGKVEV